MLNMESIRAVYAAPSAAVRVKKKRLVPVKRKSSRETGADIAKAVFAAIKEEGPICVTEIVSITRYSQNSIRVWIDKINKDGVFNIESRNGIGRARRVKYYSLAEVCNANT